MNAEAVAHAEHPAHLAHHFDNPKQQYESGKLGMWLFLATEVLMFGGLFCAYAIFRANYPEVFEYGHQFLDVRLGAINTVVLICSSLTMAWAVRAAQLGQTMLQVILLGLTLACAGGFMGIKYVEYTEKFEHGLLWGTEYRDQSGHDDHGAEAVKILDATATIPTTGDVAAEEPPLERTLLPAPTAAPGGLAPPEEATGHIAKPPANPHLFFGIYFAMTGLHGIHVLVGMVVIAVLMFQAARGRYGPDYYTPVDLVGLYWHIVDMIWIFLFPLLYLID